MKSLDGNSHETITCLSYGGNFNLIGGNTSLIASIDHVILLTRRTSQLGHSMILLEQEDWVHHLGETLRSIQGKFEPRLVIWHSQLAYVTFKGQEAVTRKSRNFRSNNSLCIFKTKASRGTKLNRSLYFYSLYKI